LDFCGADQTSRTGQPNPPAVSDSRQAFYPAKKDNQRVCLFNQNPKQRTGAPGRNIQGQKKTGPGSLRGRLNRVD
jgi:hypothetical protein